MRRSLWPALAVVASLAAAGSAAADVKIGVAGPITGGSAAFGAQLKKGAEQAVEDINAAGGILGEKIALSFGDDRADPKEGVSVANKFVGDGVKFVVGHFNSGVTMPASSAEILSVELPSRSIRNVPSRDRPSAPRPQPKLSGAGAARRSAMRTLFTSSETHPPGSTKLTRASAPSPWATSRCAARTPRATTVVAPVAASILISFDRWFAGFCASRPPSS